MARLSPRICGLDGSGRNGAIILISGESGIGKTFLATELSQQAALLGVRVTLGECAPRAPTATNQATSGNAPLIPFRRVFDAIRDRCREVGKEETARLLGPHLPVLATYFPSLSSLGDVPPPSALPLAAARERAISAVVDVLATFARQRRLLIAIDDLQWADDLSLAVLQHLDEDLLKSAPLVILGTFRSDEASEALTDLTQKPMVTHCPLGRLGAAEIGEIIAGMLGRHDAPATMLTFVCRQAEGIPFFAAEYLRMLADHELLVRRRGSWSLVSHAAFAEWEASRFLPASLGDLIARRIELLGADALAIAQAAAVAGRTFNAPFVASVLHRPVSEVEDGLRSSATHQIVTPTTEGYRFAHDKLREVLYASVPAPDRAQLHLAAAEALAQAPDEERQPRDDYAAIAHHFRQGGAMERAVDYFEKAGEHALNVAANGDAQRFFQEAIDVEALLPQRLSASRRARWERHLGDLLFGVGALVASAQSLHRAAALLERPIPRSSVGLGLAVCTQLLRQVSHRWLPRWLRRARINEETLREAARVFDRLLQVAYYLGRENEAGLAILTALNLSELVPADHGLATIYASTAIMAGVLPAPTLAERYFALSKEVLATSPDATAESWLHMEAGVYFLGRGHRQNATDHLSRALHLTTELRYFRRMDETRSALANLDILAGYHRRAAGHLRDMEAQSERRRDPQMMAWSLLLEMESQVMQELDLPPDRLAQLRRLRSTLPWPDQVWSSSVELYVTLREGDAGAALSQLEDALEWASHGRPVHVYCVGAYARLAELSLHLFRLNPADARRRRALHAAFRNLTRIAKLFPIIRPALALHRGALHMVFGRPQRARATWLRALPMAQRMALPYYRSRLHGALSEALPDADQAKALHRTIAQDLARDMEIANTPPAAPRAVILPLPVEAATNDIHYV